MRFNCFIYCGGKCGSSSLLSTLKNNDCGNTLHVHSNGNFLDRYPDLGFNSLKELILSQTEKPIYVIDSYRNPFERMISSFFQNIDLHLGENYMNVDNKLINYMIIKNYTFENYHPLDDEYPILDGIPFIDKYIKFEKDGIIYIKLRFVDIDNWGNYLSEIFGKEIKMISDNISDNKIYNKKYKEFKSQFVITEEMYNWVTKHPLFLKYNNQKEQEDYRNYWKIRIRSNKYFDNMLEFFDINVPDNFDFKLYRSNDSLGLEKYKTDKDLAFHYMMYGKKFGYKYSVQEYQIGSIIKVEYGNNDIFIDVTNLLPNEMIGIKYNDIFGDPAYGILKKLIITHDKGILEINENVSFRLKF